MLADAAALEALLNEFWTNELQQLYQLSFDPPDRFYSYRGDNEPPCGNTTVIGSNNAFYCEVDQNESVAYDLDWFQAFLINHPGGATTFLVLAHEWGHAVQDTWRENGGLDIWDPAYRKELNADCLAGVFISRSIQRGTIQEEPGDADAIYDWLYEQGGPWTDPGTHGTKNQRITAFRDGLRTGTAFCRTNY